VVAVVGAEGLWGLTRAEVIDKWSFFAALLVFVACAVPLLPIVFSPPSEVPEGEPQPRRAAGGIWLLVVVVGAALVPWDTAISSNGYRLLAILVLTFLSARIAIGVLGVVPEALQKAEIPSPDELGLDRPLTRSDALDAGRVIGLDEAELAADDERPTERPTVGAVS
jgi:hypothetical protein